MNKIIKRYKGLVQYYSRTLFSNLVSLISGIILRMPFLAELIIQTAEFLLFHAPIILRLSVLWKYIVRQKWQFALERAYYKAGSPRVYDPLFSCVFIPVEIASETDFFCHGYFNVDFVYNGLLITGTLKNKDFHSVDILLDGNLIKKINLKKGGVYNLFKIKLMRNVVGFFPQESELTVKVDDGIYLRYKKSGGVKLVIPHGDNSLFGLIEKDARISKKGTLAATAEEIRERHVNYLDIYDNAKVFFNNEIGKPLFLMYGTLLGYCRNNDFIPGDDDFDSCYISEKINAKDVKEETKKIIIRLIHSGFTVAFNRKGRLFRLQLGNGGAGKCHIDIRPLWFENGYLWGGKQTRISCIKDDFLPVEKGNLNGHEVNIPQNPVNILSRYYGSSWRIPDPGYVSDRSKIDKDIKKNLNRALLTPKEFFEIDKFLKSKKGKKPEMGRFVSTSLQNLYPLSDFIE